jgi:transcriptional regulator with XRE-family HTH domain
MHILAERLKKSRISRSFTQMDLGRKVHIARMAIEDFESGKRIPDSQQATRIANTLNVTLSYLVGKVDNPTEIFEIEPGSYYISCCRCNGEMTEEEELLLRRKFSDHIAYDEWCDKEENKDGQLSETQ